MTGGSPFIKGWEDFVDWRLSLSLQDLPFSGPHFTWSNGRDGDALILERLDRGYATPPALTLFPNAQLKNIPLSVSDHSAVFLDLKPKELGTKRPYQIDNWCLSIPEVVHIIRSDCKLFFSMPWFSNVQALSSPSHHCYSSEGLVLSSCISPGS